MPTVSVLIAVRNCRQHIRQAVESALEQGPYEVIVFDDASTDGTAEIVEGLPVNAIFSDVQIGQQQANNQLIDHTTGEYLQFLDADDYLLPGKITCQLAAMQERNRLVSYTNFQVEKYINRQYHSTYQGCTDTHNLLLALRWFEWTPATGCWLFHRSVFDFVRWDESERYQHGMHDRKMALDLLKQRINPLHVNHPGFVHRCGWSGSQISSGENYMQARRHLTEDLDQWLEELKAISWRRIDYESNLSRC
jgi:glycosyltransferase involved in cell wall biosynthesis